MKETIVFPKFAEMTNYKTFCITAGFMLLLATGYSQNNIRLDSAVYQSKLLNGMNVVSSANPNAALVEIGCYVKMGAVYENDSVSGISYLVQNILADKIASYLRQGKADVSFQNTSLKSFTTTEQSVFQLTCSPANYSACLQLLRDSIFNSVISPVELSEKIEIVRKEIQAGKINYQTKFDNQLLQRLFRKDVNRQLTTGDTSGSFPFVDWLHVDKFLEKYYVPNNTIINGWGNFEIDKFQAATVKYFGTLRKSEFDPESITKIIDFKPMLYSTQFTVIAPVEQPHFEICWQFPGVRSNVKSSYYAFLLSAMLNDPNNFIQVKARKLGCKKFMAVYDANNFSGIFKVILEAEKDRAFPVYRFVLNEIQRIDETLINETMMKAGMLRFNREYNAIKNSKDYLQWLTKYWVYDDASYFPTLEDSVFQLGERRMRKFVIEYIKQSAQVTGLMINETDRTELKADSILPDLDPSVNDYVFNYRANITDLEGADNLQKQSNLLHWLLLNPDLMVQVNGCSDKGEFGKAKDDSIRAFIDSIPTFAKVKQDLIKTGSLRPEMMRAMKMIKYLYDHGIAIDRLKGTSMPFSSKNDQEAIENMKCTITLDKLRKSPSVFEYHYGKRE